MKTCRKEWSLLLYVHVYTMTHHCTEKTRRGKTTAVRYFGHPPYLFIYARKVTLKEYVLLEGKRGGGDTSSMSN